jgi:outer membrane protein TolC
MKHFFKHGLPIWIKHPWIYQTALVIFIVPGFFYPSFTQTDKSIALTDCYKQAWAAHPLSQKEQLLSRVSSVELEKIRASRLPELSWNAQATIQSETVDLPFDLPIPNYSGLDLPLYRIQTTLEGQYAIYDGGLNEARQEAETAGLQAKVAEAKIAEASLREKINQIVIGIKMQRARADILANSKEALNTQARQLNAAIKNGVLLPGALREVEVEMLRLDIEIENAQASIRGLFESLSYLIGAPLDVQREIVLPEQLELPLAFTVRRPEIDFFEAQKQSLIARESLISAGRKPKVAAFLQAGVGTPNPLNFFDDSLSPFALGGIRFSWQITDWKQSDRDRELLALQAQLVENQRAAFEYQLNLTDDKVLEEVAALEAQISKDQQIISLQEKILREKEAQLKQGVLTSAEYLLQAAALRQAQLMLKQHELQLIRTKLDFLTQKGLL